MEVSQFSEARNGDIFDLHYTMRGWGKQGQIESLINELDRDPRWSVIAARQPSETTLVIRVLIVDNPFPVAVVVAAVGAIGTGLFVWLSLDKVEKISGGPGALMVGGALVVGGLYFLSRLRK